MSTLVLLKDHAKYGKAGTVATVPFLESRELIAAGGAERWNGGRRSAPSASTESDASPTEQSSALRRIEQLEKDCADMKAENEALKTENAELKELLETGNEQPRA